MNYLGKVINNCKYIYNEINAATLTGAIDVVVVEQPDGTFTCSPFHVRFGKIGVLRSKEKIVDIEINGEPVDIHMKLGESGEAFFVEEVGEEGEDNFIPPHLACSPIPPDGDRFLQSDWHRLEECEPENQTEALTTGSQTPKTFKAETVDESSEGPPRKLSATEFRPINGQTLDESPPKENIEFVKEDSPSADENNTVTVSKRKRRKKSIKKKHGNNVQKRNSISTLPVAEAKVEEEKQSSNDAIFQMEDLDIAASEPEIKIPNGIKEETEPSMDLPTVQELPVERDIHFFSDTEITPGSSPRDQQDFAPVQSDSEFETKRMTGGGGSEGAPIGAGEDHAQSWRWGELPTPEPEDKKQESQKWMHSMLGFMKKTKHMRHKNENEGIYLSEVNSEDPEMAALYFPNPYKQTNPAPTQDFAEPSREEDAESGNGPSLPQSPHSVEGAICGPKWNPEDIALSICGTDAIDTFDEHVVSFSDLVSDPGVVNNPKLVIRMEGKVYPWRTAAPLVMALFVFHKPLPQEVVARITGESEIEGSKQEKEKQQKKIHYSSWFNWSRINEEQKFVDGSEANVVKDEEIKLPKEAVTNKSMESNESDLKEELAEQSCITYEKYRKTLRLSSQQIAKLKLQPGANEIEFSVTTAYQGTSRCKCFLFCWRYDDQIVVSDIDGTITKSDVLGHILPIVGKDWAQSGVAKLFTKIKENGYKLLYLSARAIGQSRVTREYLKSIKQEDLTLPEGPMLLNPTSLLNAFHTEVIEKKPEEFKISCLRDIQALFPPHIKPFYAGYGNKINDVWAYQAVGIPIFRIFTINHKGELKHELTQTFQSTYSNMSGLVDQMFPASKPTSNEDFSEFVYWREPILDVETLPEFASQVKI